MLLNNFRNTLASILDYNPNKNPVYDLSGNLCTKLETRYVNLYSNFSYVGSKNSGYIILGTDSKEPTLSMYSFSLIDTNSSSSNYYMQISLGKRARRNSDTSSTLYYDLQIIGRNNTPVTVNSIGMLGLGYDNSSSSTPVLLEYTKLDSPVTISKGSTVFLTYAVTYDLNINIL